MATSNGEQVIAIEEHYWDPELTPHVATEDRGGAGVMQAKLEDLFDARITEMDATGMQAVAWACTSTEVLQATHDSVRCPCINGQMIELADGNSGKCPGLTAIDGN